jgi:hypothetical protein
MAMTWQIAAPNDSVNMVLTTGAAILFKLKSLLLANGGVIRESSDGTNFGTADYISQAGSGANGMANNYAYFVIKLGNCDFAFQRGTTNQLWRLKISVPGFQVSSAGYVAGTATAMPIVTDQQNVLGTEAPTFYTVYPADGGTQFVNMGIDNVTPHHFWLSVFTLGSLTGQSLLFFDEMVDYQASDGWPYVIGWQSGAASIANLKLYSASATVFSYWKRGAAYEQFVSCPVVDQYAASSIVGNVGPDPYNGFDSTFLMLFQRSVTATPQMKKGYAKHMRLRGCVRTFPDFADDSYNQRWTYVDDVLLLTPPGIVLTR